MNGYCNYRNQPIVNDRVMCKYCDRTVPAILMNMDSWILCRGEGQTEKELGTPQPFGLLDNSNQPKPTYQGAGSFLTDLLKKINLTEADLIDKRGCNGGCGWLAERMDLYGPKRCRQQRQWIIDQLVKQQKSTHAWSLIKAGIKAHLSHIPLARKLAKLEDFPTTVGALVDEAIELAEVELTKEDVVDISQERLDALNRAASQSYVFPSGKCNGRGIVIGAGGSKFFGCAWAAIKVLRHTGCTLPIELWYLGQHELDPQMASYAATLGVTCHDATKIEPQPHILHGWELKTWAIIHSHFEEVLWLDADNIVARDPTYLFDSEEYREHGAIFWPDIPYGGQMGKRPEWLPPWVWKQAGMDYRQEYDFESGQLLVNKARCWKELQVSQHLNENSDFWYKIVFGDKSTYHLAWRKCGSDYAITKYTPGGRGPAILQFDFNGKPLFQHAVAGKEAICEGKTIPEFKHHEVIVQAAKDLKALGYQGIYHYANQTPEETAYAEEHIPGLYHYHRIGIGERTIKLGLHGAILHGQGGCEKRWTLRFINGKPTLIIVGEAHKGSEIASMFLTLKEQV